MRLQFAVRYRHPCTSTGERLTPPDEVEKKDTGFDHLPAWIVVSVPLTQDQSSVYSPPASACVSAVVQLFYSVKISQSSDTAFYAWRDVTWVSPELSFGIVVACLPSLAKFSQHIRENPFMAKLGSSIASLLRVRVVASDKGTENVTEKASKAAALRKANLSRMRRYQNIHDGESLTQSSAILAADPAMNIDDHRHRQDSEALTMRTSDIEAGLDPRDSK